MPHPLIDQLRFTRSEFRRGFQGVTDEEGYKRFLPINSLGWMVGHLANQEQSYWLFRSRGLPPVVPELASVGFGQPASTPQLSAMWVDYDTVIAAVDPYLDTLTTADLSGYYTIDGRPHAESVGSMLRRVTYHYWFHCGESQAVRQLLGHTALPTFVGDIHDEAPYRPE